MQHYYFYTKCVLVLNLVFLLSVPGAKAQVVPDRSLGSERSTRMPNQTVKGTPSDLISGGAIRGTTLFHSFQDFNVAAGRGVYFSNPMGIANILTRVTGVNPSKLYGSLGVLGVANLFFINPNGIIFGPNAHLDIGGSFLASTADNIKLIDGSQFSATTPQPVPLLTISVPIGLRFGSSPGSIDVQGSGHNLFLAGPFLGAPILGSGQSLTGLRTAPRKTIALVGGNVTFDGGIVTAPSGRIEIGSVNSGDVSITSTPAGLFLGYDTVKIFQNIQLEKQALLDASGFLNGDIVLRARDVSLTDASLILISNFGSYSSGKISVNATEDFIINGISNFNISNSPETILGRGLSSQNFATGKGADILISANNFVAQKSGTIGSETVTDGTGGNITLTVGNSTRITGDPLGRSALSSSWLGTFAGGIGHAGDITLSTQKVDIEGGGAVVSLNFGSSNGGNVTLNASDHIKVAGFIPIAIENSVSNSFWPSFTGSTTTSSGTAGNVVINTGKLILENGGRLDSSTLASGSAGNISINASDSVNVSGSPSGSFNPTLIISSANIADPFYNQLFRLPNTLNGKSGSISINTGQLRVLDGAQITVRNDGTESAGSLQIDANSINLDNRGSITASTANGSGGDINLHLTNHLNLDHNSIISATAGGQGKGGNITIDPQQTIISNNSGITVNTTGTGNAGLLKLSTGDLTLNNGGFLSANTNGGEGGNITASARDFRLEHGSYIDASALGGTKNGGNIILNSDTLEALDSSTIKANAFGGPGGNIQVNTEGLFRSPDSVISASSTYGINGTVQFNTLVNNSTLGIAFLPIVAVDPIRLIAQGCPASVGPRASQFIVTGSGGLPPSPEDPKGDETVVEDWRTASTQSAQSAQSEPATSTLKDPADADPNPAQITEATGFETNAKGEIVGLVAQAPTYTPAIPWLQPTTCHSH